MLVSRCSLLSRYFHLSPPSLQDWTVPLGHRYAATFAQCNWVPGETVQISIQVPGDVWI